MSRSRPVLRTIKVLTIIERNPSGLRVKDIADHLGATQRAVYRDLQILEELRFPIYNDKNGRESFWKIDPDYRNRLSIPFTLTELLSLYISRKTPFGRWKGRSYMIR